MKKIILPILLALAAGVMASQKPDGLERVAGMLGFANRAQENPGILAGAFHFSIRPGLSAVLVGIMGVLVIYGFFQGGIYLMKKMRSRRELTK
jgi:hypothetical protein